MDKVFELCVADEDWKKTTALTLPASAYEVLDVMDRIGIRNIDRLRFVVEGCHRGGCLADALENGATIWELNLLARKVAKMDEGEEALLEEQIKAEQQRQNVSCFPCDRLLQLADEAVCTESNGCAARHEEHEAEEKIFREPFYTLLLELRPVDHENGPVLRLELPVEKKRIEELTERFPPEQYTIRCLDCAIPFFSRYIETAERTERTLEDLNEFARMMDIVQRKEELDKYKAILLAAGCRDIVQAAELGSRRAMSRHRFFPLERRSGPAAYAIYHFWKWQYQDVSRLSDRELEEAGRALMERDNIRETPYGLLQRTDYRPILELTQPGSDFQIGGFL